VIDSYLLLKEGSEVTEDEFFLACVLGWCVEWVMLASHHDPSDDAGVK
jgi:farnesyl diphosphate synthase